MQGLWLTWKDTVFSPEPFWRTVRPDGPVQDAFFYGWILSLIGWVVLLPFQVFGLLFQASFMRPLLDQAGTGDPRIRDLLSWLFTPTNAIILILLGLIATVAVYPLQLFFRTAILHLACMLFGAAQYGFWATFRIVAYASAPNVFAGLPYVGFMTLLYSLVLEGFGIRYVQETTTGRAVMAVLAPWILCCCLCCGLYAIVIGTVFATVR